MNSVLLDKMFIAQLVQKFPLNLRFNIVLTVSSVDPYPEPTETSPRNPYFTRKMQFNIILSSVFRPSKRYPHLRFPTKILYYFLIFPICTYNVPLPDLIILLLFCGKFNYHCKLDLKYFYMRWLLLKSIIFILTTTFHKLIHFHLQVNIVRKKTSSVGFFGRDAVRWV
jgi:hypothetical protein